MLVKTTIPEIIDAIVKQNTKIVDNSICGKCSCCGECCTNFLPICQKELENIQEYVIKSNIKPQTQVLVMQNRLSCPYYNGKKCLIYEVRPLICKEFYCYKKPTIETGKKFQKEEYITVDMWKVAKDIEKTRVEYERKISRAKKR
jgi:Fe-S-cluster containining protein